AKKIFGSGDALGKSIHFDSVDFQVTGILQDVPFFSHIQFESLVSFSTLETQMAKDPDFMKWERVFEKNYVYLLLSDDARVDDVQARLDAICAAENNASAEAQVS